VAKTVAAQTALVRQLQARSVMREYWAIVLGTPPQRGTIDAPIARDPRNPLRFRVSHHASARAARTHFVWLQTAHSEGDLSWIACRLETGRTHQIRVHMAHIGHPLLGDKVYGSGFATRRSKLGVAAASALEELGRQALHAAMLGFEHPITGKKLRFRSEPATDLLRLMNALRGS